MAGIDEIIDNFSLLDEWDDRYRYLIELGRELPPLAAEAHNDANKVRLLVTKNYLFFAAAIVPLLLVTALLAE